MPEKQRGDVDFTYPEGLFRNAAATSPVQLFQLYEIDASNKKSLRPAVNPKGIIMVFCMLGDGVAQTKDQSFAMHANSVLIIPADSACTITSSNANEKMRCVCVNLICDPLRERTLNRPLYSFFAANNVYCVVDIVKDCRHNLALLIAELCTSHIVYSLVRCFIDCILVSIYRARTLVHANSLLSDASVTAVGHTVYAVIRYIDERLYSMNNLTEMAEELGYSYNYLSHLFRKKTGMTIQSYVSRKKIERSTELLLSADYSITEIASMLNYDCIQSFSKAFKKSMNMSPTEYRAMHMVEG